MLSFGLGLVDIASAVVNKFGAISLENWEHWDTLDSVSLLDGSSVTFEWSGFPWHHTVVLLEGGLVSITGDENNLEHLSVFVHLLVELGEHWGETSAWWAPMSTEIDSHKFVPLKGFSKWLLGGHVWTGKDLSESWELGGSEISLHLFIFWLI